MRTGAARLGALLILLFAAVAAAAAELEERVASLEATAAGTGAGAVSLRVYGQVNYALLGWDDGRASDAYVVDNETSSSRLGFIGQARIGNGTVAGYRVELDFWGASSMDASAEASDRPGDQTAALRHAHWFVENASFGRLTAGLASPATDDVTIISHGARMSDAALHLNNAFLLRSDAVVDLRWGDLAHTVDSMRGNFVRYDTPLLKGFLLSAAAGEDDIWDVALRYSDGPEWLRLAGGIGFMENGEFDFRDLKGSFSALHVPTGLFATVAGGLREDDGVEAGVSRSSYFYFLQLGRTARYLSLGNTTFYGEYGYYNDFGIGRVFPGVMSPLGPWPYGMLDSKVERWGVGIEQEVEAAGLLLYAQLQRYTASIVGMWCDPVEPGCEPLDGARHLAAEPWQAVVVGARIQF
jgi:predicted porin